MDFSSFGAMAHFDFFLFSQALLFWIVLFIAILYTVQPPKKIHPENTNGKKSKQYYEYYTNYVSMTHAFLSISLAFYALSTEGVSFGQPWSPMERFATYFSLSYFLFDTALNIYFGNCQGSMLAHHVVVLLILVYTVATGTGANELLGGFAVTEISNPFNLGRDQLKFHGMEDTKIFTVVGLAFALTFFVGRFVVFPFYFAEMVVSTGSIWIKLTAASIWFVSWHWLFMIVNLMVKMLYDAGSSDKSPSQNKGGIAWLYGVLRTMRKNKVFLASYYVTTGMLSYLPVIVFH